MGRERLEEVTPLDGELGGRFETRWWTWTGCCCVMCSMMNHDVVRIWPQFQQ